MMAVSHTMKLPRFVLTRTGSGSTFRDYALFQYLESLGIPVINSPIAVSNASNKMLTYILLAENHVPVPSTFCLEFEHDDGFKKGRSRGISANDILQKYNVELPLVLKLQNTSSGRGVFLARDKQELDQLLRLCDFLAPQHEVILQEFLKESKGMDVRVWVVGDKVIGSALRVNANVDDFRSNIAVGGTAHAAILDEEMKELAVRATQVLGLDIAGVDLLLEHKDPITGKCTWRIGEVNSSPGWDGTAEDIAYELSNAIVEHICSTYNIRVQQPPSSKQSTNFTSNKPAKK